MADITKTAAAHLNNRKALSRRAVLDELSRLVTSRRGAVTPQQLEVIASVLSYVVSAAELPRALVGWQASNRITAETAAPFWDSAAWGEVLERAQDASLGDTRAYRPRGQKPRNVDPRKDWSIPAIWDVFEVSEAEAGLLNLTTLVSERRRSMLRRMAEGAEPGTVGRPLKKDRPWEAEGISQRTWQRREKKAKEADHAALVERVAAVSRNATVSREPANASVGEAVGASSPKGAIAPYNDTVAFRDSGSAGLTFYDAVPRIPTRPTYPEEDQPKSWMLRTAEARRLAALAKRLGLAVDGWAGERDASTWWSVPPGCVLSPAEQDELDIAIGAANRAESRRDSIDAARMKEADAQRMRAIPIDPSVRPTSVSHDAWSMMSPDSRLAAVRHAAEVAARAAAAAEANEAVAAYDPTACPKLVSPDLWNAIPLHLRPLTLVRAGRYYLSGWRPDDAVTLGAEIAARVDALVFAVMDARPDLAVEHVSEIALSLWWMATVEAVPEVVAGVEARRERQPPAMDEQEIREFLRRVRFEVFASTQLAEGGEAIIAEAKRMVAADPALIKRDPFAVAHFANQALALG